MTIRIEPLPPKQAIAAYEARRGRLTESFSWQDLFEEEHADQMTVAKSAGFDILKDIDAAMMKALSEGRTLRQFSKELRPVLKAKGWWGRKLVEDPQTGDLMAATLGSTRRLKTIFETNMRVSYAAGHWDTFERTKAIRPYLRYVAIMDERTRPAHAARHNLVLPVDHPYWDKWAPPCGWGCRCTLQSLSGRDVKRLQSEGEVLRFEPPQDTHRKFINRRTGEVTEVPDGIDPGWAYNPGKAGFRALKAAEKIIDAPPDLAATYNDMPDWLQRPAGEEFARWFDQASAGGRIDQPRVVVGALSRDALAALRQREVDPASGAITVTQETVRNMLRSAKSIRGRGAPVEMLRRIPDVLSAPRAILLNRRRRELLYVFDAGDDGMEKLVLRLEYFSKESDSRATIQTNAIRSASLVSDIALRDRAAYEVLVGEI